MIPSRWTEVLDALRAGGLIEACIAGGALLDLDNGVAVKDIDIFLRSRGPETYELIAKALGYDGQDLTLLKQEYENFSTDVIGLYQFPLSRGDMFGTPLQIIVMNPKAFSEMPRSFLIQVLNSIDIGLCRIGFDTTVECGASYEADKRAKRITIVEPQTQDRRDRSLNRVARLIGRAYGDLGYLEGKHAPVQQSAVTFDENERDDLGL